MEIRVTTTGGSLADMFGKAFPSELPWATAQALTTLAFMGRTASQSELADSLTLRNRFSANGIQVERAEKADWPEQEAKVGIEQRRSYLVDHILSGKRQGGNYGRAILEAEQLRSPSGRIPKRQRPGTMIGRMGKSGGKVGARKGVQNTPLPFLIFSSKWNNEVLVKRQGPERYPLEIIYAFKKGVSIKREFEMDLAVERKVQASYSSVLGRELERAIGKAKGRAERRGSGSRGTVIDSGR